MVTDLFNNYLTAKLVIAAKNEGIFDLFMNNKAVNESQLSETTGMDMVGAAALLRYMVSQSLLYKEEDYYYMEPEIQKSLTEDIGFLAWLIEGYEPVVDNALGILDKKLKYGPDITRIDKGMAAATAVVSYYKTDPFVWELLDRLKFDQVIDIGCGSGKRLLQVEQRYSNIHLSGIDISEACCELARDNIAKKNLSHKINIVRSSAEDWSENIDQTCAPNGRNLILCFAMFHDLMNLPGAAESMVQSICRNYPKGTLLMVQDQMRAKSVRVGKNSWVEGFTLIHRLMDQSLYPVSDYERIMTENGLEVVETILTDITENYIILAKVV